MLKTVRKELLTNPCGRLPPRVYAQLLFKVYDLISDMKNTEECAEVLSTLTINEDVKQELDLIIKLIQAQYMVNRLKEDEDATKDENIHQEHLEKDQRF